MLLCGWLPPTELTVCGEIVVSEFAGPYMLLTSPKTAPEGSDALVALLVAWSWCRWVGSCWMLTVTLVLPAASPRLCPLPKWVGTLPLRLGRAKFVCPFPPKVVPSSAKSAWFWLMGRSWPLQSAQPFGGKLKETSLISERNGSDIVPPPCGWECDLRLPPGTVAERTRCTATAHYGAMAPP